MVSIIPTGGDRQCVMYQQRLEQAKSPVQSSQISNYNKNARAGGSNVDLNSSNNLQSTASGYVQHQNRNIQNSNIQGTTRMSRLHNQNNTAIPSNGEMKAVHIRSASMPEAVYLKVHHHQQQTAVVPPPNHFQPLELPHQHHQGNPTSQPYNQQRLVPPQLALAPAPQGISKPMLPHLSQYYAPFIKVHPKPYTSSNYPQHPIYGPLHHPPQHPSVSLRRSQTNAGDFLGRRREAKLSTFHGKGQQSPTTRAFSPTLQNSSGLLQRGSHLTEQVDHIINLDCNFQNPSRVGYGTGRPYVGLARSRSNIAAIGGTSGFLHNQHRITERDQTHQQAINIRQHQNGRRSNLARATSFYHPSATGAKSLGNDTFGLPQPGHIRSSSMIASMTSGLPNGISEKSFVAGSRQLLGKDVCKPLHVDCSIEYDLGNQPKIPKDSAPLLIIHPGYHNNNNKPENENNSTRYHPYKEGKDQETIENYRKTCLTSEETKKLTRSAPPKANKYQLNNHHTRNGKGLTRHSSFVVPSSAGYASRKLMPLNLQQEFHYDLLSDHALNKNGSSMALSKSSSHLNNTNQAYRRQHTHNSNATSKHLKNETSYNENKDKRSSEREKESVHLSMLDITIDKEKTEEKENYKTKQHLFSHKDVERKCLSVVRRGTSVTASSKPVFQQEQRNNNPAPMLVKHSTKQKQQSKVKLNVNGKLTATRKLSTGSRDSGAASSLEADSSGGFNSFLSTMTVVSSLGSSGVGEGKRDISLKTSPSLDPDSNNDNHLSKLKTIGCSKNKRFAKSANTLYRDEDQINFTNQAVTKIKITNSETSDTPITSNNMAISTTNVKLIQNRFTQQVQNLSNNFCDSGLGTPSSLNEGKCAIGINGGGSGRRVISTTPDGEIPSSMIGSISNNSSIQKTGSSRSSCGYARKGYGTSSSSSSTSKWKSSMSGKIPFYCYKS